MKLKCILEAKGEYGQKILSFTKDNIYRAVNDQELGYFVIDEDGEPQRFFDISIMFEIIEEWVMETELKKQQCGQCGNFQHELYKRKNSNMIAECVECKNQTQIIIVSLKPRIVLENLSGSGCLTDQFSEE